MYTIRLTAQQVATIRRLQKEAAEADDPTGFIATNLTEAFTPEQQSAIAEGLEGYGGEFAGFASAIAADFLPDDPEIMLDQICEVLEGGGFGFERDG